MVIHANTKLTPVQRKRLADDYYRRGHTKKALCLKYDVSYPTLREK